MQTKEKIIIFIVILVWIIVICGIVLVNNMRHDTSVCVPGLDCNQSMKALNDIIGPIY
jgi:hypothetical protein